MSMKVKGSLWALKRTWSNRLNQREPVLYVASGDLVHSAYPVHGTFYEWELHPKPTIDAFLIAYPFAIEVEAVSL